MADKHISQIIKALNGRYKTTMLGSFGEEKFEPFHILIATILSTRTRDEVTDPVSRDLFNHFKSASALADANYKKVAKIIKRVGFYRTKTRNIIQTAKILCARYKGRVPQDFDKLIELPGVGRKVANCVLVYAFGEDAIPVDTHVHRISNRLGWVKTKTPEDTETALAKIVPKNYWLLINELFVAHGKQTCLPRNPHCQKCSVIKFCKRVGLSRPFNR